jgi:hypothetical protein
MITWGIVGFLLLAAALEKDKGSLLYLAMALIVALYEFLETRGRGLGRPLISDPLRIALGLLFWALLGVILLPKYAS